MKSELMRKFGVKKLVGANLEIICKECGLRLEYHYGTTCPTNEEILYEGRDYDSSVKDANEPDHDLEYHDKKIEGR